MDEVTKYLLDQGYLRVNDSLYSQPQQVNDAHHHDFLKFLPEELRDSLEKMMDPVERKKMLTDIYKTRVFVASYWMIAIFFLLLFLPESKFFAPFVAGYIGGRKAGSMWKGAMAALVPFILLGLIDLLVFYNVIYHFYDLYLPSAGILSNSLLATLADFGLDTSGVQGSFYDPGTSLSKCCIYMVIASIIGGTLEGDDRRRQRDTAMWMNESHISNQISKKKGNKDEGGEERGRRSED